jgi:hypothetical protein
MVKLTFAVAALMVASVAGTRIQAQSEQFVSDDQAAMAQDAPANAAADATPAVAVDVAAPVEVEAGSPVAVDAPAPAAVETPVSTGPSMEASALSPRLSHTTALSANAMRRPSRGSGVGLMIFGGAALITGLIIGDNAGTVIAVGGALVGLYGLYVYLGRPTGMGNGQASHSERIGLGYKLNTN